VLLCYLIGNDFLPHLPALDILDGALNDLIDIYKRLLPKWGDYLTLLGEVDLARLADVFPEIGRVIEDNLIAEMQTVSKET
jgi:5'-3' exoribonuclease 2